MKFNTHLIILVAFTGILFLSNLGGYDLWPPDEPRFAEVTREMMDSGDYLVPRANGIPYKEKPPLLFWAQALASISFGGITEISARLPSALAGIFTVLLTFFLGRRLFDERTAFWAGLILATFQRFWWQAHFGQIDMLLTFCLTAAFYFFWIWHTERKSKYLIAFYMAIAAGVFAKGPPALVFPMLMTIAFYWNRKEERKGLHFFYGLLFIILMIAAWLIPARMAISNEQLDLAGGSIGANLFRQTIGRVFLGVSHAHPPWYYLINLPLDLLPWSLFLPWAFIGTISTVARAMNHAICLPGQSLPLCFFPSVSENEHCIYCPSIRPYPF